MYSVQCTVYTIYSVFGHNPGFTAINLILQGGWTAAQEIDSFTTLATRAAGKTGRNMSAIDGIDGICQQ